MSRRLLPTVLALAATALVLWLMGWLSDIFVPLGAGLLLAFVLAPSVDKLQRWLGTRTRAAGLLVGGFLGGMVLLTAVAIPMIVQEVRHWVYAVTGEGAPAIGPVTKMVDYGEVADPDATAWRADLLVAEAQRKAAPPEVVKVLRNVPMADPKGELTLAEALGDGDADGRLDPGYARRLRALLKDRDSWLGALWSRADRAGLLKEAERAWRQSTSREQIRKLLGGSSPMLSGAGDLGMRMLESVSTAVSRAFGLALAAVLIPVYAFFFLLAMPRWAERLPAYLPRGSRTTWLHVLGRIRDTVAAFVRGRLVVCGIVGVITAIGWAALGVRMGLLAGLGIGALTLIPLANVLLLVPVLLMSLLDVAAGTHGLGWLVGVVAVYAVGQIAESVLNPVIVGDAVQLDMVSMIVALLIGGTVAGFFGLLVAVPLAATGRILLEELVLPRWRQWAAEDEGGEVPVATVTLASDSYFPPQESSSSRDRAGRDLPLAP